jgi:hypothetical protein
MISPEEYAELKKEIDERAKRTERKRGELARVREELKKVCGDENPKRLLHRIRQEREKKEKEVAQALKRFKREHPNVIE